MHKIVNGKKTELSDKESGRLQQEWDAADKKRGERDAEKEAKTRENIQILKDDGLSNKAIKLLYKESAEYLS